MQTTYSLDVQKFHLGQILDSRIMRHVQSRAAEGPVRAGYGVFRVPGYGGRGPSLPDPGQVYQQPSPAAAVDVDAIVASGASAATPQTISGAGLTGVVAGTRMTPARNVTLILSSHADWDLTTAVLTYVDPSDGKTKTENLAIPNGGNTTVTSVAKVAQVVSLTIPAQSGTGGAFTVGITILDSSVISSDFEGLALWPAWRESALVGLESLAEYGDGDTVSCLLKGGGVGYCEQDATAGDPVYCRFGGVGTPGAFRKDDDSGTAVLVPNARWGANVTASNPGPIELF